MSTRQREDDKGEDERRSVKIDGDSKKSNRWKSVMEMKEYLRSEYEKKTKTWRPREGQTYLHFAACLEDVDATKILIEDNAEVDAVHSEEWTALHWAAGEQHIDVAKVLIRNGADVNAVEEVEKETALHLAANRGHVDFVKLLIQNGADVNAAGKNNYTALHIAAERGLVDVVKVLLQNGANVNAVCVSFLHKRKQTAIHMVDYCEQEVAKMVLTLLCFGADIDKKTIALAGREVEFPPRLYDVLVLLRDGTGTKTTFMSQEERHFMWNLRFVLAVKHPAIAFGTYHTIRSFITYRGVFMGLGYDLGYGSPWRELAYYDRDDDYHW